MKFNGKIRTITALLSFVILLVIAGNATAATITVPDDYSTIQAAINAANPGDTVYVKAGTYDENLTIDKPLTLQGANKNLVILTNNSSSTITVTSGDVIIQGFTFDGLYDGIYVNLTYSYLNASNQNIGPITITDNRFINPDDGVDLNYEVHNITDSTLSFGAVTIVGNYFDVSWDLVDMYYGVYDISGSSNIVFGMLDIQGNYVDYGGDEGFDAYYEVYEIYNTSTVQFAVRNIQDNYMDYMDEEANEFDHDIYSIYNSSTVIFGNLKFTNNTIDYVEDEEGIDTYYDVESIYNNASVFLGSIIVDNFNVLETEDEEGIYGWVYLEAYNDSTVTFGNFIVRDSTFTDIEEEGIDWSYEVYGYNNSTITVGNFIVQDTTIDDTYYEGVDVYYELYGYYNSTISIGNFIVRDSTITYTDDEGIYLYYNVYSTGTSTVTTGKKTIQNNEFSNIDDDGFYLNVYSSSAWGDIIFGDTLIDSNTLTDIWDSGIYVDIDGDFTDTGNYTISYNSLSDTGIDYESPVYFYSSLDSNSDSDVYIFQNDIVNSQSDYIDDGIWADTSRFNATFIHGNTIESIGEGSGIYIEDSEYIEIHDNLINNTDRYGIYIDDSDDGGLIYDNTILDPGDDAIYLYNIDDYLYIYRNNIMVYTDWYEPYDYDGYGNYVQWWSEDQLTYFYNNLTYTNYMGNYYEYWADPNDDYDGDGIIDDTYDSQNVGYNDPGYFEDEYPLAFPWEVGRLDSGSGVTFTAMTDQGEIIVTMDDVTSDGVGIVNPIPQSQAPNLPNGFLFLDIKATAGYTGYIYITVYYNESQLPSGLNENTMKLYHYKNGAWHDITYSRDTVNNTITGRTTSLSVFGIGLIPSRVGAPAFLTPGKFFKSDQIGLRQRVPVNETATFGIYLKNLDDQLNTINITYSIDKETPGDLTIEVPESITLEPLEEKQININITPNEKGSFIIHFKAESAGAEYVSYDFVFVVDAF